MKATGREWSTDVVGIFHGGPRGCRERVLRSETWVDEVLRRGPAP